MKSNLFTLLLAVFMSVSCQPKAQTYTIETSLGNIKVKLFENTPLHKENFEKLVAGQFYDSVVFHRIIPRFMIQTGNGATKTASAGERPSGDGDLGYTVPAEFVPENFHKKGALAAARTGDHVNPEKRSSCSQFYIVQGRTYSDEELDALENQMHQTFSEFQRGIYKTLGGTPFLDGNYTVFGEVTEGLDVVDKIASVPTGPGDWPLSDIRILRIVKN
ncbi:MAG: peptidylprolyl isomerase [Dysgonamonadaceae bacterium]|jgi:peptidyl-prolyl cis-trans isomerase B (cyclophilin B)|nr:peptidylprolyl isomerase [Dysgonamonadaceae bacterium]